MNNKIYAVKKGRRIGLFYTWDECKLQIDGFSGAEYKSFTKIKDANEYLGKINTINAISENDIVSVYVDGSYDEISRMFSYGIVFIINNEQIVFSKALSNKDLAGMRNVAGEIKGSENAMRYCIENNIKKLNLYYDYEGIEKWCTEEWKATKKGTQQYRDYYNQIKNRLNINFIKVKAHSGNKYNELADNLAKEALQNIKLKNTNQILDKNQIILRRIMSKPNKAKNNFSIIYKNMYYTQSRMRKLAIELYEEEGNKKDSIKKINFNINIENNLISINITDNTDIKYIYKINL